MLNKINSFLSKSPNQIALGLFCVFIYYLPFLYLGEDSTLVIHDNLDSTLSWVKMLLDNSLVFAPALEPVNQAFNGLPKFALYGTIDLSLLWFYLFGMYKGYIINKILLSFVGFIGMYLLLNRHLINDSNLKYIPWFTALLFALLPYWSFTLSVSGIPLILFAFLNLKEGDSRLYNWCLIVLFGFYSSLALSGIFLIIILALIYVYDAIKYQKLFTHYFFGLVLLGITYLISHYPLFNSILSSDSFISHRTAFDLKTWNLNESLGQIKQLLVFGQYHAHSLHHYITIPIVLVALFGLRDYKHRKTFLILLSFVLTTSIFYGILRWESTASFFNKIFAIFPIQLQRFHYLHPTVWYVLLGMSLMVISKRVKYSNILVIFILLFQLIVVIKEHELITQKDKPTYKQFYSVEQFDQVKKIIALPQKDYRVISVGLHPSIAQYNGFYTLDGYFPNYPLSYKNQFRKIISGELAKDTYLTYYFDHWGSRCYAFCQKTRRLHLRPDLKKVKDLEFDYNWLKSMGGTHIISSAEIDTSRNTSLKLLGIVDDKSFFWTLYVYENLALAP